LPPFTQEIQQELKYARELYAANPEWPVLDVTFRYGEMKFVEVLLCPGCGKWEHLRPVIMFRYGEVSLLSMERQ
jgi:hypothetical protein